MSMFQIEGLSGTGKSTLCEELIKRGYNAIDADDELGYFGDPDHSGQISKEGNQLYWNWNSNKLLEFAEESKNKDLFICGGSMNQENFAKLFSKRFTLYVDDETLKYRLLNRKNNDFGKKPEDLARQLEWNKGVLDYANARGMILIDSTKPITEVADLVINLAFDNNDYSENRSF